MGDQTEDGLQLNVFIGAPKIGKSSVERYSSRSQRIKARRKQRIEKQQKTLTLSDNDEERSYKERTAPSEIQSNRSKVSATDWQDEDSVSINSGKRTSDSDYDSPSKTKRQKIAGPVISSLFRNNPVIPQVTSATHQQKEDLFSSKKFSDLGLHPFMVSQLEDKMKLTQMTRIQQLAIPHVMTGSDTLIRSPTGAGKTWVFVIPIIQELQAIRPKIKRSDGPYAMVIVPSRELALQCYEFFKRLVQSFLWIVPGCIVGGENRKAQKARIRKGMNVIIGTPGRLLDHINNTGSLALTKVHWLVIDEADRMFDMGYEKDIAGIITALNSAPTVDGIVQKNRQTILLSATLTEDVQKLAGMSLRSSVMVDSSQTDQEVEESSDQVTSSSQSETTLHTNIPDQSQASTQTVFSIPETLKQNFIITPCKLRLVSLAAFIMLKCKLKKKPGKMLVFMSTQDTVEFHFCLFKHFFGGGTVETDVPDIRVADQRGSLSIFKLHGAMEQKERVESYQKFCSSDSGILFCTDVACRGLDLPNVRWIVQYTSPGVATEYVQRAGRTARAGKVGHSALFLMPSEVDYIKYLNDKQISLEEMRMDKLLKILPLVVQDYLPADSQRQLPRTYEEACTYVQMSFENYVQENKVTQELAKKAFQSYVRAYATYPSELKSVFHIKSLHLGHLAKTFALRDAPSEIYPGVKGQMSKKTPQNRLSFDKTRPGQRRHTVSEFDSGLKSGKLSKFQKKVNSKLRKKKLKKK